MSIEKQKDPIRLTTRAKRLIGGVATGSILVAGVGLANELEPEMHGNKIVVVSPGDTVDQIINVNVIHGASHTGDVREHVRSNPDNADVFENGHLDPGEELEIPEKVTD